MADDPMDGVTTETIELRVTAGQYRVLEQDRIIPGRPRVTHKVTVGPFMMPGLWVVVATQSHQKEDLHKVTLARLED